MRLEDTFDAFPIHKLDLNLAEMSAKDIWLKDQEDCVVPLSHNYTREDIERQVSEQVRKEMKEQIKLIEKRVDEAKAEGLRSAARMSQ